MSNATQIVNTRQYTRPYVNTLTRKVFRAVSREEAVSLAGSNFSGPFKTTKAAQFVAQNPNFVGTVTQAERTVSMTIGSGS